MHLSSNALWSLVFFTQISFVWGKTRLKGSDNVKIAHFDISEWKSYGFFPWNGFLLWFLCFIQIYVRCVKNLNWKELIHLKIFILLNTLIFRFSSTGIKMSLENSKVWKDFHSPYSSSFALSYGADLLPELQVKWPLITLWCLPLKCEQTQKL